MAVEGHGFDLIPAVALLGAGVVAVPIFRRLGLGSVLGYLAAGIAIGPFGIGLFQDPEAILSVAELGVVMLLFIIGLEMKPSRLWSLRREIFGLGVAQIGFCGLLLSGIGYLAGYPIAAAFIAAMGFTMTSTAIVLQLLDERGETNEPPGQRIVSVLLLEDLAIVPLLAAVALLAPEQVAVTGQPRWLEVVIALAAVACLVAFSRFLLNPIFGLLAEAQAREVMTAAALLVVLGSALVMDLSGLSMAMGAFIAGVLLSESTFRHQLEADIEPFRGLLLGLFFLSVGMSLDLSLVVRDWTIIIAIVGAFVAVKSGGIYIVARAFRARHPEAIHRALLMAQGGEFAFVLYTAAGGAGIFDADLTARLNAAVIISMAITPLLAILADRLARPDRESFDGVERADGLTGTALLIGFGRFGQVVSQPLLARGVDVSIIDNDTEMIRAAARFGFKIYYGDGTRLDVLHAAGAGRAKIIAVCVDTRETAHKIVEIIQAEFPLAQLLVRSYDRGHTLDLIAAGVAYQIRETFESAMTFGAAALGVLGIPEEETADIMAGVRDRDSERLKLQQVEGIYGGRGILRTEPTPVPLTKPRRESRPLSEETAVVAAEEKSTAPEEPAS
jgi:glutathione-regulated potassium-efflux system protein KefB